MACTALLPDIALFETGAGEGSPASLTYPLFFGAGSVFALAIAAAAGSRPTARPLHSHAFWAVLATCFGLAASTALLVATVRQTRTSFMICLAFGGIELAILRIAWGLTYRKLGTTRLGLCTSLSFLVAIIIVAVFIALPRATGPWVFFVLSICAGPCLLASNCRLTCTPEQNAPSAPAKAEAARPFWPLATGMFTFVFASSILQFMLGPGAMPPWLETWRNVLVDTVVAIAFVAIYAISRPTSVASTYRIVLPLMALGYVLFPLVPGEHRFVGAMAAAVGYGLFDLLSWVTMIEYAQTHRNRALGVIGLGVGATLLGRATGSLCGTLLLKYQAAGSISYSGISLVMLFALIVVCLTVLPELLMKPAPDKSARTAPQDAPSEISHGIAALARGKGLTTRELDVLELLAKGKNAASISLDLGIARGTAQTHIKHIYQKTGFHNQQELMRAIEVLGAAPGQPQDAQP